jgi:SAM-dependent methyltransferase
LGSSAFKDHFSGHSVDYAAYRPGYPERLFEWLAETSPGKGLAWDSATGNGQAAVALSEYFDEVVASDASASQIAQADHRPNIRYIVERAEDCSLSIASIDLATVAQAYHWYDFEAFHQALDRVVRPGGLLAVWTYPLVRISEAVDEIVLKLYEDPLSDYWPPERRLVDREYRDLSMPWGELSPPEFEMRATWTLEHLLGYLSTWSAVQRFIARNGKNPILEAREDLAIAWGDQSEREVHWPLIIRVSRKPAS